MGGELVAIFIVGIVSLCIYRLFELFVRRKERMALIEKISLNMDSNLSAEKLYLPLLNIRKFRNITPWVLNISLLMIGVGLGLVVGFFVINTIVGEKLSASDYNWDLQNSINNYIEIIYFASVFVFGGIGLLIAYFIDQKNRRKENN